MNDITKKQIIDLLQIEKDQGHLIKEAAIAVWNKLFPVTPFSSVTPTSIFMIFAEALDEVYDPNLRDYALTLKALAYSDILLITALHKEFGDVSAIDLGAIILDKDIYPNTSKSRMKELLTECGFPCANIEKALKILYPLTFSVIANKRWQSTELTLEADEIALISADSSMWRVNSQTTTAAGGTNPTISGFLLQNAPVGALLARIDNKISLVGMSGEISATSGKLELSPNATSCSLSSNSGSISVTITVNLR